ncbi:hypothetical protein AnigIFM62618_008400 [Aspergillus niger]|nr:hypothetical protein AnigIFM62618_008400 [Aspergillus niger]
MSGISGPLILVSTVTLDNYARAIISLSRRYSSTSAFPGNNYMDIAEWMIQERYLLNSVKQEKDAISSPFWSEKPHDLVVVYNSGERQWDVQQYSQEQHEDFSAATPVPASGSGQIVFIRGFISPSWVSAIGSKYNIEPEFFKRHMDFLSMCIDRHSYSFPSLVSSSNNIIRLCVSTILHRDDFGGQDLQSQRSYQRSELGSYRLQQLGSNRVRCGDSLVREYSTVCPRFSVIEQWISLYITKTDREWAVIAWMDHGRPLEESPPGPWSSHLKSKATALPILQYHPKMAFRTTSNRLDPDANVTAEVQQSTTILPLQYDSLIALVDLARRAPQDPLSMCIPLFAHAAFSEVQFLNLMESRIQKQVNSIVDGLSTDALGTLQYFSNILNRHAQQLKDSTRALFKLTERSSQGLDGTRMEKQIAKNAGPLGLDIGSCRQISGTGMVKNVRSSSADGTFTTEGLLEDYEQLYARCMELSNLCTQGISLAMNKATIDESRRAIEQSERVKKLTLLATLFIPLSFSSSLLGMNIDLLGQNSTATSFPAVRACIFDLDGLLINTEDIITLSTNKLLDKYGRPAFTQSIRAQLMGIPKSTNGDVFHSWARLPISQEQFARESTELMQAQFPNCKPLPGAEKLLSYLNRARSTSSGAKIQMALASSTKSHSYEQVLGDDPRVRQGRGKPAPDIFLVALQALNPATDSGVNHISPNECLVFEDSVIGVEAARRAGMRVVWVPHPDVAVEYQARQDDVLAGRTKLVDIGDAWQPGEIGDSWAECIKSLEHFDYEKYGIDVPL